MGRQEGLTSRYIPNTITPSLGASMISSGGIVKIENSKERLSIASICSRAYVCKDAVMKPLTNINKAKRKNYSKIDYKRKNTSL